MSEQTKPAEQGKELTVPYEEAKRTVTPYFNGMIWTQIKGMAETFIASKALPTHIDNPAKAVLLMQAGIETGLKPVESLNSLYIVNGQINFWGKALVKRYRDFGYRIEYKDEGGEKDQEKVTAVVSKGDEKYTESYSFPEAMQSGSVKYQNGTIKPAWAPGINRKLKLRYGVLAIIAKTYIPEILGSATDVVEVAEDFTPVPTDSESTPTLPEASNDGEPATEAQKETVRKLAEKAGVEVEAENMSQKEAKEFMASQVNIIQKKGK